MDFLTYKGKPLVRSGKTLYYGDMSDKYVIKLDILTTKKVGKMDVAENIAIELRKTDSDLSEKRRVEKSGERKGLYNAIDLGQIWLQRALNN